MQEVFLVHGEKQTTNEKALGLLIQGMRHGIGWMGECGSWLKKAVSETVQIEVLVQTGVCGAKRHILRSDDGGNKSFLNIFLEVHFSLSMIWNLQDLRQDAGARNTEYKCFFERSLEQQAQGSPHTHVSRNSGTLESSTSMCSTQGNVAVFSVHSKK